MGSESSSHSYCFRAEHVAQGSPTVLSLRSFLGMLQVKTLNIFLPELKLVGCVFEKQKRFASMKRNPTENEFSKEKTESRNGEKVASLDKNS
jgi:hypothetical protein